MRCVWVGLLGSLAGVVSASGPLKIMPLGDSITHGMPVAGGYRAPLYSMLASEGYSFEFVGSMTDNSSAGLPSINHEGHPGWKSTDLSLFISSWLTATTPDVVLLHIGTNDISMGAGVEGTAQGLNVLMGQILTQRPQTTLIVASIVPRWDFLESTTIQYNLEVPGLVQSYRNQGYKVSFVDIHSVVGMADLADGIHPNQVGYNKMATAWNGAIQAAVPTPEPGSFVILGLGLAVFCRRRKVF